MIVRSKTVAVLAHDQVGLAGAGIVGLVGLRPVNQERSTHVLLSPSRFASPFSASGTSKYTAPTHASSATAAHRRWHPRRTAHPRTELSPVAER